MALEEGEACRRARPPRATSGAGTRSAGRAGRAAAPTAASSSSASRDFLTRGWYWSSTPRSLPDASSGASASRNSRNAVSRSASSWPGHPLARLGVEDEAVRRPLGPLRRRLGRGQPVEGRVDLDRVEALGVVGEAAGRRGDPARVPVLDQPLVGPAAGAEADRRRHVRNLQSPDGLPPRRRLRLGHGRPDRPARVPRDDAARGLRLPRRRRAAPVRAAAAARGRAASRTRSARTSRSRA